MLKNRISILGVLFYVLVAFVFSSNSVLALDCTGKHLVPHYSCTDTLNPYTGLWSCTSGPDGTQSGESCYESSGEGCGGNAPCCITYLSGFSCVGLKCNSSNRCSLKTDGEWDCARDNDANPGKVGCCQPSCPSTYCASPSNGCGGNCACRECGPDRVYTNGGSCGDYIDYYSCKAWVPGCTECEMCNDQCGQDKDCGGQCGNDDNGSPGSFSLISPLGTLANPATVIGTTIALSWGTASKAERYEAFVLNSSNTVVWRSGRISSTSTVTGTLNYGQTYHWYVIAHNTTCDDDTTTSSTQYFMTDYVPTLDSITLKNSSGTVVAPDSSGRNNICQEGFVYDPLPRRVTVEARIRDTDVAPDGVKNATLRWNGNLYPLTLGPRVGNVWVGTITLDYPVSLGSIGPYDWELRASDLYVTSAWIDSNRAWKIWDCQVEVNGTLYDGSAGQVCNSTGFSVIADDKLAFASLIYKDMNASDDVTMNVSLPANYGVNDVIYGKNYLPLFNGGSVVNPDGTIMGSNRFTRSIDLNTGTTTCATYLGSISQFNFEDLISAYEDNPRARVDFSFIRDQEGWFQVRGSGVKASSNITSGVPVTMPVDSRALSVARPLSSNGLVSYGGSFSNINGFNDMNVFGTPNNWWVRRNTTNSTAYTYQYFYNNFYVNNGVGITGNSWATHPSEGVYFVDGDLNINSNFILDDGKYFIVIVRGKITIADNVNALWGIYIADGNSSDTVGIEAGGNSDDRLTIVGSLYSQKAIRLHRSFNDKSSNNTMAAVRINYEPNLLFNIPGSLMRVLSGWREE